MAIEKHTSDRCWELYQQGLKPTKISRRLGITHLQVQNCCRWRRNKIGMAPHGHGKYREAWTEDEITKVAQLRKRGWTYPDIARNVGRSAQGCMVKHNIEERKRLNG